MSYTVIGDAVNLGARLESLNKDFGTRIIVSEPTRQALSDSYAIRFLDNVVVRGKTTSTPIYEVTGYNPVSQRGPRMKSLLCLVALLSVANSAAAQIPGAITKGADVVRRAQERQRQLEQLVISEEDERKLGIGISAKLRDRFGVLQSADAHTYVTTVGLLLASASERPKLTWTFVVLDTDGVNAFAAPGGFVHVTRGLLAMLRNEAELATVLGHEIAHVSKRHTITAIRQGRAVDLGTDQTFGNQPILDWVSDKKRTRQSSRMRSIGTMRLKPTPTVSV